LAVESDVLKEGKVGRKNWLTAHSDI